MKYVHSIAKQGLDAKLESCYIKRQIFLCLLNQTGKVTEVTKAAGIFASTRVNLPDHHGYRIKQVSLGKNVGWFAVKSTMTLVALSG